MLLGLYSKAKGLVARISAMVETLLRVVNGEEVNVIEMEISWQAMKIATQILDVSLAQSCKYLKSKSQKLPENTDNLRDCDIWQDFVRKKVPERFKKRRRATQRLP